MFLPSKTMTSLNKRPLWKTQTHEKIYDSTDIERIENRVKVLEFQLDALVTAILTADDVSLNERHVLKSGVIYTNISTSAYRHPRLLRTEVLKICVQCETGKY
jgi:hypothetical protein